MNKEHELHLFLTSVRREMQEEYERIIQRAVEDPGTAGDEGEANWADLLRAWIPERYHVTTKGRIVGANGDASPQLDLVILDPSYPPYLRKKKMYLAAGVVAAFECKTTLKKAHLSRAFKTAKAISSLTRHTSGSPYRELFSPIIYGVLAHGHSWASTASAESIIDKEIDREHRSADHPADLPDLLCINNLNTWTSSRVSLQTISRIFSDPTSEAATEFKKEHGVEEVFVSSFLSRWIEGVQFPAGKGPKLSTNRPNQIASLLIYLFERLELRDASSVSISNYFVKAGLFGGTGPASTRHWSTNIYSKHLIERIRKKDHSVEHEPREWNLVLP